MSVICVCKNCSQRNKGKKLSADHINKMRLAKLGKPNLHTAEWSEKMKETLRRKFDLMGSGTTALVAKKLGRNYIGIELNPDYIKIAEKRLAQGVML